MDFTITPEAEEQISAALENQPDQDPPKDSVRIEAKTNGTTDFAYGLKLITSQECGSDDSVLEMERFKVVIDPQSARHLEGATLDFEDRIVRSGFRFKNPNNPEVPELGKGTRDDLVGATTEKLRRLIDTELNPAVAAHGGVITLVGVKGDQAYLSFGGGCHGCGMVDVTLKQGVETRIRELIPEISNVVDTTDHSTGENPFYS